MSLSDPFTLLISALSPSEPFQAPHPPTVASRLTNSRFTRGSTPAVRRLIEPPRLAPAPGAGRGGAGARGVVGEGGRERPGHHVDEQAQVGEVPLAGGGGAGAEHRALPHLGGHG